MSMRAVNESLERQGTPRSLRSEAMCVSSDEQMELETQQFNILKKKVPVSMPNREGHASMTFFFWHPYLAKEHLPRDMIISPS